MYKVASGQRQSSLHRGRLSDWQNGELKLTVEEEFRQAKEGIDILEKRIKETTGKERQELGVQKLALQNRRSELREILHLKKRHMEGLEQFIIDAMKENLPKNQLEMIMGIAKRKYDLAQKIVEQDAAIEASNGQR